ncbi:MAG: Cytidylate kinase [Deltaproteobacteria bacterium ADurb.BinA179]|nr:MAG: Cytidylate kinase [Deltaproteobacteria bacterium ADurb.BinA179]
MKHAAVTIDGPAGSGKSTIARQVADRLGFVYLDTGALYRAAALAVDEAGADSTDGDACAEVVRRAGIGLEHGRVSMGGRDVTEAIRSHRISSLSSQIAVHPQVRDALLDLQRSFREKSPLVAEGRDTGSVVFPDADVKIYIDASAQERARRRHRELVSKGVDISYEKVLNDLKERDQRDATRSIAPLVVPQHAVVVDTTHLRIGEVISKVLKVVQDKLAD